MRRYHLFDMWGASTKVALCGRKLANPWTVQHRGMHSNVCTMCRSVAVSRNTKWREYTPIEDRGAA